MGALDLVGNELIEMMNNGKAEKALLYIYLVDLFDDVDDNTSFESENKQVKKLQEDLMKKAKKSTSFIDNIKDAAVGRAEDTLNSLIPGNKTSEYIGEKDSEHEDFVKFYVQYNPSTIKMRTINGRQESKNAQDSIGGLRSFDTQGKTKLSFDLVFDDVDNMDAFGLNELANVNATSLVNKGLDLYAKGATGHSVRKRMDAIMSLLASVATQQVVFCWGKMSFRGQLTDVSNKFTMFNSKGNPVRGEMHIEITQDAGQKEQFEYDDTYWDEAFAKCFKEGDDTFAGKAGGKISDKLRNNSLINLGI